jgi:hypothetical protein
VRVFELDTGQSWAQYGEDIVGSSNWYWFGWKVTMSTVGNTPRVAVAAFENDANGNKNGVVRVHRYGVISGTWGAFGSDIVEENIGDETGFSLDLDEKGDYLAVGSAFNSNTGGESAGHVRIYKYDSGWTELGYGINGSNAYDYLGSSLALANDDVLIVAVGAPGASGNRGLVAVYEFDGTEWQQKGDDLFGDNDGDQFGFSVSLSKNGTRLTVGAKQNDAAGYDAGSVRVYDWKRYEQVGRRQFGHLGRGCW